MRKPHILSIAGSDPSGGAGIQADLKSIAALGGYGMAALTSLTAQNTMGVQAIHQVPSRFLRQQLDAIAEDITIDAVKVGMLGTAEAAHTVAEWIRQNRPSVVVLDPVLVASSGDLLLSAGAEAAVRELCRLATVVTPNLPELAALAGEAQAQSWEQALEQGLRLSASLGTAVIVKGGHLGGAQCPDALVDAGAGQKIQQLSGPRIKSDNTHGTGCSLSSALATLIPQSPDLFSALSTAKRWLSGAITAGAALEVGHGHGPVDHFAAWEDPAHRRRASSGGAATASGGREIGVGASAARPLTSQWWHGIAPIMDQIRALPFIRDLAAGSLDPEIFRHYLAQDALYLRDYARVLARASQLAPSRPEQVFWAKAAQGALVSEMQLHDSWLHPGGQDAAAPTIPSPETRHYLQHLCSSGDNYGVAIAAALPCFWIYQVIGMELAQANRDDHPYASWLQTYNDAGFEADTRAAIAFTEAAASAADPSHREAMWQAFLESSRAELAFFAQRAAAPAPDHLVSQASGGGGSP